ncbi:CRISPR-associated protein, Csy1 family [Lampropedia hyalina DSM 16112]|jgi:CRISPR-associated protein Csy1|uniref:CRISPR-associated protein, Csy1 family n=1 Tax=Lampropedia hyalina DSM 16112 TaxID=1122156 RepID=A0A1M4XYG6_9BURK|nr:type I-F CRISPR-associated protein Csy1 [Lampropedia hyalina]SHE98634.1 CRISPR-associated protein, Csy1 family [Lampropedia hyalina DSM 16112]
MEQHPDSGRTQRVRAAIQAFLQERLQDKLDKLKDNEEGDLKRSEWIAQFQPAAWLADAARRASQIQAVTHSLKPIHPDARGTNLYKKPTELAHHAPLVGSHLLREHFSSDVVGNAAALDVYKLLKLQVDGKSLLEWLLAGDASAVQALSDDPETAQQWQAAFVGLTQPRDGAIASHQRAKQLYWLIGNDPTDNAQYHLLAPLYATSLAHSVYTTLQEDRFGDDNKAARTARKKGESHEGVLREYPDLAVQKLGGTKPQNISQLNSERGGSNYLLASLPPQWQSRAMRQPWGIASVFDHMLMAREGVRPTLAAFLQFLKSNPPTNADTRNRVDAYVSSLIDELVTLAGELQRGWPDGWTADSRCKLVQAEQLWLDPRRAETDETFRTEWLAMDWPAQIGHRFGNWLNTQLEGQLRVGDAELREWKKELLLDESDDGWAQSLHRLRSSQDAPQYIPARQGVVA